jgi:hypothetical protein
MTVRAASAGALSVKQHYPVSTCRARNGIGYLIKRADSLMFDVELQWILC